MLQKESILVLGASANPERSSYMATRFLYNKGFSMFAVSNRKGRIDELEISDECAAIERVDTITIYLKPERQKKYYEYILSLHPKRIIFNPGTENPELENLARKNHIMTITGCTIAMISAGII